MSPLNLFFDNGLQEEDGTTQNGVESARFPAATSIFMQ
jgi:hypothetical protein